MTGPERRAISIRDELAALPGPWQPADVVRVNDAVMRVARLEGEFPWHVHDEDELFLCWDGEFAIELEGRCTHRDAARGRVRRPEGCAASSRRRKDRARDTAERKRSSIGSSAAKLLRRPLLLERPETEQYGNR